MYIEDIDIEDIDYSDELVLVVDDEKSIREILVQMLRNIGLKAQSVSSGKDALVELRQKPYTFLLTDIKMEKMDGLELIRRSRNGHPNVCIIAMTGYYMEYKYVEVVNAGAVDFINKPFNIEELEAKIKRAIIERNTRKKLSIISITDSLTDVYNQRHFFSRLKEEITRAKRQKHKLALIIFDLDDFKSFNDKNGHLAGDEILKEVGTIVKENIRQDIDSGYRYGGDEFAIILIDSDQGIAEGIGKRIEMDIGNKCNLTVSMGYAIYSKGMTFEEFINEADVQLYKAKRLKNIGRVSI